MTVVLQTLNGLTIGRSTSSSRRAHIVSPQASVNVAHGLMLGAYLAIGLYPRIGFAATVAAVFTLTALLGLVLDSRRSPLVRWKRPGMQVLVLTSGRHHRERGDEARLGPGTAAIRRPRGPGRHPDPRPIVYRRTALVIAFTAVLMNPLAFFHRTTLGILVQSIALNSEICAGDGHERAADHSLVFALADRVAGVAGVLAGPILARVPDDVLSISSF